MKRELQQVPICPVGWALAFLGLGLLVCPTASADYVSTVLADSPLGYWRLEETTGDTLANSGTDTTAGTRQGSAVVGAAGPGPSDGFFGFGADNRAVNFTGSNPRVYIDPTSYKLTGALTLEAWINPITTSGSREILARYLGAGNQRSYELRVNDGGTLQFFVSPDGTYNTDFLVTSTSTVPTVKWTHVVGVFDPGNSMSIYINGAENAIKTTDVPSGIYAGTEDLFIGARDGGTGLPFLGRIDEAAIYSTALAADRVLAHYNAAIPEPSSLLLLAMGAFGLLAVGRKRR